ncbi:hypothetical protein JRO89_XS01G0027900 [Xanthoceras sorbifolium]|uniref:Uncharacterized protein n=1 Tax=Xanthoceras sorbifolium TaxID=99658 RepID=A0ABQ8II11_9ROSI|nr:hypothetical protein JRO89_XS01G0027900 [Xanthoceras sorbifolium]
MRLPERNHDDEVIRELQMDAKQPVRKFRVRRAVVAIKASNKMRPNMQKISCQQSHFHHNLERRHFKRLEGFTVQARYWKYHISIRHHFVFTYVIPLLIGLLQVDYQSKNASPFDTHPINMWIFFAATAIYCLGLSIKMDSQNHQSTYFQIITGHFILFSGALSSVSLASIFLPRLLGWFCLGSWIVLRAMMARHCRNQIYIWLKHSTVKTISFARDRFNRFWGCITLKKEHLPM